MVPRNKVGASDSGGDLERLVGLGHMARFDWRNGGDFILCPVTEEKDLEIMSLATGACISTLTLHRLKSNLNRLISITSPLELERREYRGEDPTKADGGEEFLTTPGFSSKIEGGLRGISDTPGLSFKSGVSSV